MATIMGIGDANPPVDELTPPPPPPPTPTPIPTMKPTTAPMPGVVKRNVAFDVVRSRGIAEVWEHKTKKAVNTFQHAQSMKPKDISVKLWLDVIAESGRLHAAQMAGAAGLLAPAPPAGALLPLPPVTPVTPPKVPGAGAATVGRSVNVPDPRLVF